MSERIPALNEISEPEGTPAWRIEVEGHGLAMADWVALVNDVEFGKRLPEALYLHCSAVDGRVGRLLAAASTIAGNPPFEVVKFGLREPVVSLLHYPMFDEDPFPELRSSVRIDFRDGSADRRSYSSASAPILHRKELMLRPGDPRFREWAALTRQAEDAGLFTNANTIGTRMAWEAALAAAGLQVEDHVLVPARAEVFRHRTALVRYTLSTPMQALLQHDFLDGKRTVLDYGCGRGGDLAQLARMNVPATGWDPHFAPDAEKSLSDVVNLGFVLNVIEDPEERIGALRSAWELTRVVLCVAVLIKGRSAWEKHRLFGDGVLTSRGTFQKYFLQEELRTYIEQHTGRQPIALAPGLFFVFRSDEDEQAFLAERQRGRALSPARPPPLPRPQRQPAETRPRAPSSRPVRRNKWQEHEDLLLAFWATCLRLGRLPEADEFTGDLSRLGSMASVLRRCLKDFGNLAWEEAKRKRHEDLLVWLALGCFEQRRSYSTLPAHLKADVKAFWRAWSEAQEAGRQLLFSAGNMKTITAAASEAVDAGVAAMEDGNTVCVRGTRIVELPPVLRVLVGCVGQLYGDSSAADVVKVHLATSRVTLLNCDDFDSPLPNVIERVRVDLRRLSLQFQSFDSGITAPEVLLFKSRLLAESDPSKPDAVRLENQLSGLGIAATERLSRAALDLRLAHAGVKVEGSTLSIRPSGTSESESKS
jgi:DNA phosphorothioation-associated putative methyltransferase